MVNNLWFIKILEPSAQMLSNTKKLKHLSVLIPQKIYSRYSEDKRQDSGDKNIVITNVYH